MYLYYEGCVITCGYLWVTQYVVKLPFATSTPYHHGIYMVALIMVRKREVGKVSRNFQSEMSVFKFAIFFKSGLHASATYSELPPYASTMHTTDFFFFIIQ